VFDPPFLFGPRYCPIRGRPRPKFPAPPNPDPADQWSSKGGKKKDAPGFFGLESWVPPLNRPRRLRHALRGLVAGSRMPDSGQPNSRGSPGLGAGALKSPPTASLE